MSEHRFRVLIGFDGEKECFVARAPELEKCTAEGETAEGALKALTEEIDAQIQNMKEAGGRVPQPIDEEEFSGEVTLKISKSLHRELAWLARLEEISEEQVASELFQAALSARLAERPRRRRRPGGQPSPRGDEQPQPPGEDRQGREDRGRGRRDRGGRNRYHQIMDDRANFIEYVRGLEGGGGGGGGHRHGKGPKRR